MATGDVILSGTVTVESAEAGVTGALGDVSSSVNQPWKVSLLGTVLGAGGKLTIVKANSSGPTNCPFDITKSYTIEI